MEAESKTDLETCVEEAIEQYESGSAIQDAVREVAEERNLAGVERLDLHKKVTRQIERGY